MEQDDDDLVSEVMEFLGMVRSFNDRVKNMPVIAFYRLSRMKMGRMDGAIVPLMDEAERLAEKTLQRIKTKRIALERARAKHDF